MSIYRFHFVAKGEKPSDIACRFNPDELLPERLLGAGPDEGTHTICVMWGGVEHLFIFEEGATAAEAFERWRRQPCERIVLSLDGVEQVGERLPANSVPDTGCEVDISWDGDFDTDGDPNGPARWKVRCGRPVAEQSKGRPFCEKHLGEETMSDFNTANEMAAQLVRGRHYQGDEPCFKLTKIVFHHGNGLDSEDRVVVEDDGKSDWAVVASRIQALLGRGYDWTTLPCEYCGATEIDDVLHCDECGEAVPHGHEHASIDEDGDDVTYCDGCQPGQDIIDIEHTIEAEADIIDLEELL